MRRLSRQLFVSQSPSAYRSQRQPEPEIISHVPVVEPKALFVQVTEQMERHHENVRAVDGPLEVTPEILHAVRVDMTLNVLYGMVNNLVNVLGIQAFIRLQGISEQLGSGFDMCFDMGLERLFLATFNHRCSYRPTTLQNAYHHRLVLATSPGYLS
jgi:hypothetical protein